MAALILVRHGQASLGAENYDCLSDLGERQGEWLGEYFAQRDIEFDRVLVGSMQRQRQTVTAILRGLGNTLPCEEHAGLNEYDFQALYRGLGNTHQELSANVCGSNADYYKGLKQVLYLWSKNLISGPVPETWEQFQRRVANVRGDIQHCGGRRVLPP